MRALIFDLDGTLVDTVYAHVFAWQQALAEAGMPIDGWRVHRRIGMSGGLFTGRSRAKSGARSKRSRPTRSNIVTVRSTGLCCHVPGRCRARSRCCGACVISASLTVSRRRAGGPRSIPSLEMLEIPPETVVIERGDVMRAKPEPDLFLACQERLGVHIRDCFVIGDAVWDLLAARRAGMLSVGVLSGGYGAEELIRAGAFRVYRDARELDESLDELGVLP